MMFFRGKSVNSKSNSGGNALTENQPIKLRDAYPPEAIKAYHNNQPSYPRMHSPPRDANLFQPRKN